MLNIYDDLTTERIMLRKSVLEDCHLFGAWEADERVSRFFTMSEGRGYDEVKRDFIEDEGRADVMQLTICFKESGEPIGRIVIKSINHEYDSLDITRIYIGDIAMRGLGLGESALRACLKLAFEQNSMERVTLDYFTGNDIAKSLYEKVGFVHEGCMRHGGKKNGEYVDLNLMSILRREYFAKNSSTQWEK